MPTKEALDNQKREAGREKFKDEITSIEHEKTLVGLFTEKVQKLQESLKEEVTFINQDYQRRIESGEHISDEYKNYAEALLSIGTNGANLTDPNAYYMQLNELKTAATAYANSHSGLMSGKGVWGKGAKRANYAKNAVAAVDKVLEDFEKFKNEQVEYQYQRNIGINRTMSDEEYLEKLDQDIEEMIQKGIDAVEKETKQFEDSKASFIEQAAEAWLTCKYNETFEQFKAQNPGMSDKELEAKKQASPLADYVEKSKPYLFENDGFMGYMDQITDMETLGQAKRLLEQDGMGLYAAINEFGSNAPFNLDRQIKRTQRRLNDMKAENNGVIPDVEQLRQPLSEIIAAYQIKNLINNDYKGNIPNTKDGFTQMADGYCNQSSIFGEFMLKDNQTLFEKATKDKGGNLWSDYRSTMNLIGERRAEAARIRKEKKAAEEAAEEAKRKAEEVKKYSLH